MASLSINNNYYTVYSNCKEKCRSPRLKGATCMTLKGTDKKGGLWDRLSWHYGDFLKQPLSLPYTQLFLARRLLLCCAKFARKFLVRVSMGDFYVRPSFSFKVWTITIYPNQTVVLFYLKSSIFKLESFR